MPDSVRLAVFDCEGTLVDSQYSIIAAMQSAFRRVGLAAPGGDAIRRIIGLPLATAARLLATDITEPVSETLCQEYSRVWQDMRRSGRLEEPLYTGTVPALDALRGDGWQLGVATGKSHGGLLASLQKYDILDRFATLQTADRSRGKPHPEMLLKAMQETGAVPERTLMIGDTTFDMEMARQVHVVAIGVSWGYHDAAALQQAGAVAVLSGFQELRETIQRIERNWE
jgi:phosphoglycolate phosphatase